MKLPGVESADVSLDKASADIRLKEGNRITLPQLRELLRKNGYPTRDAQVEARGRLVEANGKLIFDLLNGSTMAVQPASDAVALRAGAETVTVSGVSRAAGKTAETLSVKSVSNGGNDGIIRASDPDSQLPCEQTVAKLDSPGAIVVFPQYVRTFGAVVRVRILRPCRGKVDGISLDRFTVGRVYDVHASLATYLMVERFATAESDTEPALVVPLSDAEPPDKR
jgi:hypothetical protein